MGDGRILLAAVERFNVKEAVGYEIREDVYQKALQDVARRHLSKRITVINDDLFRADLSKASVITFYLDSFADENLKGKLERETSPGTRIVSHDFSMLGWRPTLECSFEENGSFHMIYVYAVPKSFSREKPCSKTKPLNPRRIEEHVTESPRVSII